MNSRALRPTRATILLASPRALSLCAALPLLLIAVAPQCYLWAARGRAWQGTFLYFTADERAYAAYVNALAEGRPRRNDPYTGRDAELDAARVESLFSVQPLPAYALALAARALRVQTSAVFFALLCAASVAAPLVLFRLIRAATGDARLAAAGALFVLCLGTLASGHGVWDAHLLLEPGVRFRHLPFLRRYLPALPFPVFFGFCALVRRALARERRGAARLDASLAGLCLAALVYSYFYLWTAAAAWLFTLTIIRLAARPQDRRQTLARLSLVAAPAALALVPYGLLLARIGAHAAQAQALEHTRAPDLFRVPELLGLAVVALLAWARRRGRFAPDDGRAAFAASFALLPFAVFNQQVVTGLSLQPMHYDVFVVNYCALLAAVLAAPLALARVTPPRLLVCAALAALAWASFDTAVWAARSRAFFVFQDEADAACERLAQLGRDPTNGRPDTRSLVFAPSQPVTDFLPTRAPQPVLWASHTVAFSGASLEEEHERLLQYLYYSGVDLSRADARSFETLGWAERFYLYVLLGAQRVNPELSAGWRPLTRDEIRGAFDDYSAYAASFDRARAARFPVSYLLVYDGGAGLPNFDRWYERDAGERVGHFTLYRVRLRDE
jgi:hypothetical protein